MGIRTGTAGSRPVRTRGLPPAASSVKKSAGLTGFVRKKSSSMAIAVVALACGAVALLLVVSTMGGGEAAPPARPNLKRTRSGTIGPDQLGALQKAREADAAKHGKHKHKHTHKHKHKPKAEAASTARPALQRRRSGTLSLDGHAAVKKAAAAAAATK